MDFEKKIVQLRSIIAETLVPLIDNDFVLFEVPYYTNIGDILIWEGEIQFVKQYLNKYKMIYSCSSNTCKYPSLNKDTIILLQGGGNFGDLWKDPQNFRKKIIEKYTYNKIIIFPQTVFYNDENKMKADAKVFSKHKNLTICARDKNSYQALKENFKNNIILVPDMAFCIPVDNLNKFRLKKENKTLFLKRSDKELNDSIDYLDIISEKEIDIHDWPSIEKTTRTSLFLYYFFKANRKNPIVFSKLTDIYASYFFKPEMIKIGVNFLSKYNKIYTTRLHVAILCCLLKKPCTFFDNNYGKNSSFFETWLNDVDGIEFIFK